MLAPYHFMRDYYLRISGAFTIAGSLIPTGRCYLLLYRLFFDGQLLFLLVDISYSWLTLSGSLLLLLAPSHFRLLLRLAVHFYYYYHPGRVLLLRFFVSRHCMQTSYLWSAYFSCCRCFLFLTCLLRLACLMFQRVITLAGSHILTGSHIIGALIIFDGLFFLARLSYS